MADEYQMEEGETTELPESDPGEELVDVVDPSTFAEEFVGETEEEPEELAEESEPEFSDQQYLWGQEIGLTREQVQAFGTPEAFDGMIERISTEEEYEDEPDEEDRSPLQRYVLEDSQDYDEGIVKFVDYANDTLQRMSEEVDNLKNENSQLMQAEYSRRAETNVAEFERIVNTMDEATFGRGEQDDLPSHEAESRMRLAEAVSRLGHGYEARGEQAPPMARLVEEASGAVFGNEIKNQALRKVSERSRQQRSQASAVPTHEDASPLTSEEAAVKAATEWQQEKGWR